jgi:hypothetical protein
LKGELLPRLGLAMKGGERRRSLMALLLLLLPEPLDPQEW